MQLLETFSLKQSLEMTMIVDEVGKVGKGGLATFLVLEQVEELEGRVGYFTGGALLLEQVEGEEGGDKLVQ